MTLQEVLQKLSQNLNHEFNFEKNGQSIKCKVIDIDIPTQSIKVRLNEPIKEKKNVYGPPPFSMDMEPDDVLLETIEVDVWEQWVYLTIKN